MRVKSKGGAYFPFQTQFLSIGWQQQFNGRRIEANSMVDRLHSIFGINTFERHHRTQNLRFGNQCRIAGKKRLQIKWFWRRNYKIHPVGRNIHSRNPFNNFVDLCDDDALLKFSRLDDHRSILGIGAGIKISVAVRLVGSH